MFILSAYYIVYELLCIVFCLQRCDEVNGINHIELFRSDKLSVKCHLLLRQGPVVPAVAYVSAAV